MRIAAADVLIFLFSTSVPALSGGLKPATLRLLFTRSYAPPASIPQTPVWWRELPLNQGEAMSQSICCAILPPMCGQTSCHFAARLYMWTDLHRFPRKYLLPPRRMGDPHQEVRFLIRQAYMPIEKVRRDFLSTNTTMLFEP